MKATVKLALPGYAGKMDDLVIYFNPMLNKLIARKWVKPAVTPANADFTAVSRLVKSLGISAGYITDCRRYVDLYNRKNRRRNRALFSWTNVFFRMMLQLKRRLPDLDLVSLTKAEIYAQEYPCISVAQAVQAGLLEKVAEFQQLDNQL